MAEIEGREPCPFLTDAGNIRQVSLTIGSDDEEPVALPDGDAPAVGIGVLAARKPRPAQRVERESSALSNRRHHCHFDGLAAA